MNRFSVVLLIAALFFLGASAQTTEPIQDPSTLHCYQVVSSSVTAANFSQALLFANESISNTGLYGYLATITTQAEFDFVQTLITDAAADFWTAALAIGTSEYVWQAGPEKNGVVFNATGCHLIDGCFGITTVTAGTGITVFNGTFASSDESIAFGYIIEFDGCLASPSPSSSPSAAPTTTSTSTSTTSGASVSPSTFRPTITLGTLTTGKKSTTGKRTTGKKATTGRRRTTGKVSAASSMSFSGLAVAFAAVSMLFLRR